ncbi:hypothetical protein HXX76_009706 [Chlamydomonas incerta]|uniref:BZIP domain-containing protein n=1 Tax=Chlamydomonas incerta TaxID=51695 RepID=A0A835SWG4_CHLIN|nr:hypothetical protein HXX76_009706 [Chlamydomonas incerta]|eukprot:KAG2431178.1 hypothetical protein HXX76_009706 [Chlamydomonas incerta]
MQGKYTINDIHPMAMDDSCTNPVLAADCDEAAGVRASLGSIASGGGGALFAGLLQQSGHGAALTEGDFNYFSGSGDMAAALPPLMSLSPPAGAPGTSSSGMGMDAGGGGSSDSGAAAAAAGAMWPRTPKRSGGKRSKQPAGDQSGDPDTPRSAGSARTKFGGGSGGMANTQRNREAQQRFRQRQREAVMALEMRVSQLDGEAESLKRAKRMVEAHNECLLRQLREAEEAAAAAAERMAAQAAHIAAQAAQIAAQTEQMAALTAATTTLQTQVRSAQQQVAAQIDAQAAVMRGQLQQRGKVERKQQQQRDEAAAAAPATAAARTAEQSCCFLCALCSSVMLLPEEQELMTEVF